MNLEQIVTNFETAIEVLPTLTDKDAAAAIWSDANEAFDALISFGLADHPVRELWRNANDAYNMFLLRTNP